MLKKIILFFLVIIVIIITWFIYSLRNNYVINEQRFPMISGDFLGKANCSNTKMDWSCTFDINASEREGLVLENGYQEIPIIKAYETKCDEMGGRWYCGGFCDPAYTHSCGLKFKDAGDLCISSIQCGGKCLGDFFGAGKCSEYPVYFCERYQEIFFGIPISHRVMCD
jgi:hypothetical protein